MIQCPKCQKELIKDGNRYCCSNGHSYDVAKEGYVNLILANQKHSSDPGDAVQSLQCRQAFLEKGYYQKLAEHLCELIGELFSPGSVILDAGCGSGYYLNYILKSLPKQMTFLATDIAKKGMAMTAKKCHEAFCFVGNVFHLPLSDNALDGLISVFTPYSAEEFLRIVKPGGYVIAVNPGTEHLYQLKQIVYDEPYYNEQEGYHLPHFELVKQFNVTYPIHLDCQQDIEHLWKMMPYYHTTRLSDSERLLNRTEADTVVDFLVSVYRKEDL